MRAEGHVLLPHQRRVGRVQHRILQADDSKAPQKLNGIFLRVDSDAVRVCSYEEPSRFSHITGSCCIMLSGSMMLISTASCGTGLLCNWPLGTHLEEVHGHPDGAVCTAQAHVLLQSALQWCRATVHANCVGVARQAGRVPPHLQHSTVCTGTRHLLGACK